MAKSEQARKQLLDRIEQLIEAKHFDQLRELLSKSRTSYVAEVVEVLDDDARQILFDLLDPPEAGEVLEKIDEATRSEVVEDLSSDVLTKIVATLPPDEAADVMAHMSPAQTEEVLDHIPSDESDQIEKLLSYDEDTAGGIMTPILVRVKIDETIREAIKAFRQADPEEDFYYVFVEDENGVYRGTVSIHALLRHPRNTPISQVVDDEIPQVEATADQEEVANIFRKNDLITMPVVDQQGILLGRITVDDVVDVMEEEAEEDVLLMAGTHPNELDTHQPIKAAAVRLPWLLTCMGGALFSALIFFSLFRPLFTNHSDWLCIIMFIPAIAAMGGNSGMQTSTIVVRGLATGDLVALDISQAFLREIKVGSIVALTCGTIAGILATAWLHWFPVDDFIASHSPILGFAVGMSMFCAILLSTLLGMSLPYLFKKIGVDPAISSGPLVTTANDVVSYLTYFSLSLLMLKLFG